MYTLTNSLLLNGMEKKKGFEEVRVDLGSGEKGRIMEALHELSRGKLGLKQRALVFPMVVTLIRHQSLEVKSGAYSFILKCLEIDRTLLLLAVNTVKQEMGSGEEKRIVLNRALAIDFIGKTRDKDFLGHFFDEIEREYDSEMDVLKKSALLATPSLFRAFKEVKKEKVLGCLRSRGGLVTGAAVYAIVEIEKMSRGVFGEVVLMEALDVLCRGREEIEERFENFGLLLVELCRLLRPFKHKEIADKLFPILGYLPLFALREVILSAGEYLVGAFGEKLLQGAICFSGTEQKLLGLETILLLFCHQDKIKTMMDPFLIDGCDSKREKMVKLQILSKISGKEAVAEIRAFVRDGESCFCALCLLIELDALEEDDIRVAFKHCPSAALRAFYLKHPLPLKHAEVVRGALSYLSNVVEKEAYLFLSGYYLTTIPDEAKRIRRIRNSAGGILYGKKEEREKSEEHLEEYLYFLLNFYVRGIISKEECIKQAQETFMEEPFLLSKFMHLVDLPDRKHLLDLISYKRISYRVGSLIQ
ncbi:hypothetical protein NEHOM01_0654 [Nematocida homosporus]|uniref:uncharacterized protein n=1 Tax=Nematocida homosporus TaxID=1912981 RepID=UPI00221F04F6|nr:uncharacterized protein NEHOM01_0654 [Nematocida homosporus]KAI5185149.1 hypothetical protein NEHOM01_0654 [Nematocida homosporus]